MSERKNESKAQAISNMGEDRFRMPVIRHDSNKAQAWGVVRVDEVKPRPSQAYRDTNHRSRILQISTNACFIV